MYTCLPISVLQVVQCIDLRIHIMHANQLCIIVNLHNNHANAILNPAAELSADEEETMPPHAKHTTKHYQGQNSDSGDGEYYNYHFLTTISAVGRWQ